MVPGELGRKTTVESKEWYARINERNRDPNNIAECVVRERKLLSIS